MSDDNPDVSQQSVDLWDSQLRIQAAWFDGAGTRSARALRTFFFELVDTLRPDVFIEAGAFDAMASRTVKLRNPSTKVVAFEANPRTHSAFSGEIDFVDLGVDYRLQALASDHGSATFHLESPDDPNIAGSSSLLKRNDDALWRPDSPVDLLEVETAPLDHLVPSGIENAAIWIDVEGASRDVLLGATQTLKKCALLMIEVEEESFWSGQWLARDVFAHLLSLGFIPLARDSEFPYQYNVVFARAALRSTRGFIDAWSNFTADAMKPNAATTETAVKRRARRVARRLGERIWRR